MSGHHWTDTAANIDRVARLADKIEIEACCDADGVIERCDPEQAELYSVYFHYAPHGEPDALQGVECIADRGSEGEARALAVTLSAQFGLPVYGVAGEAL
ncbi:hypothetical protein [Parasphingorhabdus sp.]|uniref:hypothetical protein n=1 Tax=Parasphingorhabdus sp. TaxID=2709688 RepID=UPI003A944079